MIQHFRRSFISDVFRLELLTAILGNYEIEFKFSSLSLIFLYLSLFFMIMFPFYHALSFSSQQHKI